MLKLTNLESVKIQALIPSVLGQMKPGFYIPRKHQDNANRPHFT